MKRFITVLKKTLVFTATLSLLCGSLPTSVKADEENPFEYEEPAAPPVVEPETPVIPPEPVIPVDPCAYGHDLISAVITFPTCTTGGVTRYYCTRCDFFEDHNNEPAATGHVKDDGIVVQVANCVQDGLVSYHCVYCAQDMGTEAIPRLEHVSDSGTVVQEATAVSTGRKVYKCVNCGIALREEILPCIEKRATPSAVLDTSNAILSNIPENCLITVNGNPVANSASNVFDLSPVTSSQGQYSIQIKANATADKAESDIQTIHISKPGAPTGVYTKPLVIGKSFGSINGVDANMEYMQKNGGAWTTCPNGAITIDTVGAYLVRYKATSTQLPSNYAEVTVTQEETKRPDKPAAGFNGEAHTITKLPVGAAFSTNCGDTWTKVPDGNPNYHLSQDAVNQAVTYGCIFVKNTVPVDSDIQVIDVYREATPSGISTTAATNGNNGTIKGVGTDMQYRIEGGKTWFDIGSNTIAGLAPNTYYVRRKAYGSTVESNEVKVVVSKGQAAKSQEGKPNAVFNAYNMVIDDISGCKLSFDCGNSWTSIIYDHRYSLSETQVNTDAGIQVYRPGNGSTTKDSEIQFIYLTKQSVPAGVTAVSATSNSFGTINGVDNSMQYRNVNSSSWVDVPTGSAAVAVPAGTYYLRRHGYGTALASDALTVVIKTQTVANPIVPSTDVTPTKEVTVDKKDKILPTKDEKGKETTTDNGIIVVRDESLDTPKQEEKTEETKAEETKTEEVAPVDEIASQEETPSDAALPILSVELGWTEIEKTFESVNQPVIVNINTSTEVPSEVFTKAVETNTPLVLAVDSQAVWSVEPSDISVSDMAMLNSVDLGVTENTNSIPTEVLNTVEDIAQDQKVDHTFDIKHEGNFGFTASLTVKTAADSVGKNANLYWYNTKTGKMEYIGSSLVNEKAEATFKMNHASSYAVVVSKKQMSASDVKEIKIASADNTEESTASVTTDSTNEVKKSNTTVYVIIIILILALIATIVCIVMMMKKKR